VNREIRELIRQMSLANPFVGCTTNSRRNAKTRHRSQPGNRRQTYGPAAWSALTNLADLPEQSDRQHRRHRHVCSCHCRVSFAVSVILGHARRKILHLNVTQHPTAGRLSRQITEAFPWDTDPRYLLRDRDTSYGGGFQERARAMEITEVVTAPRSPWQNAYVERVIGSIRRECLDQVVVTNERHLRRVLISYADYYHHSRTHLSLDKDCPHARPIQPPNSGKVIAIPQFGGFTIATKPRRLIRLRGLRNLRRRRLCGNPCRRVQNPYGECQLPGLARPIGDPARALHRTVLAAAQNLTRDGVFAQPRRSRICCA
jgi:transposase InsO family protein